MADRADWEHVTQHTRHMAVAADAELRRRHPDQRIDPLRSGEPAPSRRLGSSSWDAQSYSARSWLSFFVWAESTLGAFALAEFRWG
jgi:hypothetical protein